MARQIFEAHGKRYLHPVESMMRDAPPGQSDPEARLDYLIARPRGCSAPTTITCTISARRQLAIAARISRNSGVTFDSWFS